MYAIGECGLYALALKQGSQRCSVYVLFLIMLLMQPVLCDAGTLTCFTKMHYDLRELCVEQAMTKCPTRTKKIQTHLLKEGSSAGMCSVAELKSLILSNAAQRCSISAKEISHYMASTEVCFPLAGPSHREDVMHRKAMVRMYAEIEHSEGLGLFIFKWDASLYKDFLCFDV